MRSAGLRSLQSGRGRPVVSRSCPSTSLIRDFFGPIVLTHSNKKWWVNCWLAILVLVACSGGGDGGTGYVDYNDEIISNKKVVFENAPLAVSYTQPAETTHTNFAFFAGNTLSVEDDMISALEQAHDQNCKCSYEIVYTRSSE